MLKQEKLDSILEEHKGTITVKEIMEDRQRTARQLFYKN